MGKSFRKPWGTWVAIKRSAHADKTTAARMVRRAQEQSLKEAVRDDNWDGWLVPERYECSFNDVWCWGRDGKQRPLDRGRCHSQYNNPYAYVSSPTRLDHDGIMKRWLERMQHDDEFMAYVSRK